MCDLVLYKQTMYIIFSQVIFILAEDDRCITGWWLNIHTGMQQMAFLDE